MLVLSEVEGVSKVCYSSISIFPSIDLAALKKAHLSSSLPRDASQQAEVVLESSK